MLKVVLRLVLDDLHALRSFLQLLDDLVVDPLHAGSTRPGSVGGLAHA